MQEYPQLPSNASLTPQQILLQSLPSPAAFFPLSGLPPSPPSPPPPSEHYCNICNTSFCSCTRHCPAPGQIAVQTVPIWSAVVGGQSSLTCMLTFAVCRSQHRLHQFLYAMCIPGPHVLQEGSTQELMKAMLGIAQSQCQSACLATST